jgi:hypothetical protein
VHVHKTEIALDVDPAKLFVPSARSAGIQVAEAAVRESDVAVCDIIAAAFDRAVDVQLSIAAPRCC